LALSVHEATFSFGKARMKRLLLVGAHNVFRQALAVVVGQEPDLEVAAQAGSLAEARRVSRACDVAVVDLPMPDGDGAQFVWELRRSQSTPRCTVVVLTESLAGEDHLRARAAGVEGVLSKAASLQELIGALKRLGGT
jgi:DNA-binding NarL/FixJ family response regulator